jgi:hypothetical protein
LRVVNDGNCCAAVAPSLFDMHKVAWRKALGSIDHRLTVRAPVLDALGLAGFQLSSFSTFKLHQPVQRVRALITTLHLQHVVHPGVYAQLARDTSSTLKLLPCALKDIDSARLLL